MKIRLLCKISYFLLIVALLVTLFHYNLAYSKSFSVDDFLDNPSLYVGEKKTIKGVYAGKFEQGFFMIKNQRTVKVHLERNDDVNYGPPRYGEVLIYGTLQRDGSIFAEGVHNYNYAYISIYGSSFLAGLIVLFYFLKEWKITWRGIKRA